MPERPRAAAADVVDGDGCVGDGCGATKAGKDDWPGVVVAAEWYGEKPGVGGCL